MPVRKPKRRPARLAAVGVAVGLHAALLLLFATSADVRLRFIQQPDGEAMIATLTPASAIAATSAASAMASSLDAITSQVSATEATPPSSPSPTHGSQLLQQMDAVAAAQQKPLQARAAAPAAPAAQAAPVSSATPTPTLQADNPWAHASVVATDASRVQKLWAAIKPCWRGDARRQASIRLVLDADGRVQSMTALGRVDPDAMARAETAAQAITACAPYRGLARTTAAYLVVAPS